MEFILSVSGDSKHCVITLKNDATNEHMSHYLKFEDVVEVVDALNHIIDYELEDEDNETIGI